LAKGVRGQHHVEFLQDSSAFGFAFDEFSP
jgi:hypothetical protein